MKKTAIALSLVVGLSAVGVSQGAVIDDPVDFFSDVACATASLVPVQTPECGLFDIPENINQDDTAIVKSSSYSSGLQQQELMNQAETKAKNFMDVAYGIGMAEGKTKAVAMLNNGSSISEAQSQAYTEVQDWYGEMRDQQLTTRNRHVLQTQDVLELVRKSSVSTLDTRDAEWSTYIDQSQVSDGQIDIGSGSGDPEVWKLTGNFTIYNESYELVDGTDHVSYGIKVQADIVNGNGDTSQGNYTVVPADYVNNNARFDGEIMVSNQSFLNDKKLYDSTTYKTVYNEYDSNYQRAIDNTAGIVNEIYDGYQSGQVNLDNYDPAPLETLKTAGNQYNTTGYYGYKAVSLAQMGLSSNDSYSYNVSFDGSENMNGQLFVNSDDFNGTLKSGETYTASGKRAYIVYQNGSRAEREAIDTEFTIKGIEDPRTGETLNKTTLNQYEFYTSNVSDLKKQLEENRELIEKSRTGGELNPGFSFGGFELPPRRQFIILAVLAVMAVLVAL